MLWIDPIKPSNGMDGPRLRVQKSIAHEEATNTCRSVIDFSLWKRVEGREATEESGGNGTKEISKRSNLESNMGVMSENLRRRASL